MQNRITFRSLLNEARTPKDQLALIKYFKSNLKVKVLGKTDHLRTQTTEDWREALSSVAKIDIKPSPKNKSSKFDTYIITTLEEISGIKAGTSFYYVNSKHEGGQVSDKEFTPDSLGLGGKTFKLAELNSFVLDFLNKSEKTVAASYMIKLVNHANNKRYNLDTELSQGDIKRIAKDFGEITGAMYLLSNVYNGGKVEFPSRSNEPLVDYYIHHKGVKRKVSAKAGNGAAPSIGSIIEKMTDGSIIYTKREQTAVNVLLDISNKSIAQGQLDASAHYMTPGWKWCVKNKLTTLELIEDYLSKFKTLEDLKKSLQPFYDIIGRSSSDVKLKELLGEHHTDKIYGIITAPLGYHLADIMNNDPNMTTVLNKTLSAMSIEQLYLDADNTNAKYTLKEFKNGKFKFSAGGSAKNPNVKRISFSMIK